MTHEELADIAYRVSTSNHLTQAYNFKEFQNLSEDDISKVLWEPLEGWEISNVINHISQIAESFINQIEKLNGE